MIHTIQTLVSGVAIAVVGYALTSPFVVQPKPPQVRHLTVDELAYVEIDGVGAVRQKLTSKSGELIPAEWRASIERIDAKGMSHILCTGNGSGGYNGELNVWDLDQWTNDNCQTRSGEKVLRAQPGDFFEVSWTYYDQNGWPVTIGGRFELSAQNQLILITP